MPNFHFIHTRICLHRSRVSGQYIAGVRHVAARSSTDERDMAARSSTDEGDVADIGRRPGVFPGPNNCSVVLGDSVTSAMLVTCGHLVVFGV
jgi:hypothetical protein